MPCSQKTQVQLFLNRYFDCCRKFLKNNKQRDAFGYDHPNQNLTIDFLLPKILDLALAQLNLICSGTNIDGGGLR